MRGRLILVPLLLLLAGTLALSAPADAGILRGLDSLPRVTAEQAASYPKAHEPVRLLLRGELLPYDRASNTYFIPQSAQTAHFEGAIEIERREGYAYSLRADFDVDKAEALLRSTGYTVYGVKGDSCAASRLLFTALPVLCITTESGALPEAAENGTLRAFSMEGGALACQSASIEINLRGNTSRRHPKKSYRIKLVDANGDKRSLSLANLRTDDDWILNPLYSDASKIREKLAYELWDAVNSSGVRAQSSRMAYAEVFINGEYRGLYGLQERVDNKQVGGRKQADILYKVIANDRPSASELLACEARDRCRAFEPQHADAFPGDTALLWTPAAAYIAALDGTSPPGNCAFDRGNLVEYALWAMLTQAHDCHFKNQFLNCVYTGDGYAIYKLPWDLNNTFGDVWSDDARSNFTEHRVGKLVMDGLFARALEAGDAAFHAEVRARWAELREGIITEENILARARALSAYLTAARERDGRRWPNSGLGEGNARDIADIEAFVRETLPRVDAFVAALGE